MDMADSTPLLRDTLEVLDARDAPRATVERAVAGSSLLLVEFLTTDGSRLAGVVHSPGDSYPTVTGRSARDLVDMALEPDALLETRALGVAALNALSVGFLDWDTGDPMESLDRSVTRVGMVGMFAPAFGKFDDLDIRVVERFPEDVTVPSDLPESVSVSLFGPGEAAAAFEDTSVVFITGSTLIYGGLETYLDVAPDHASVVLIGSSASMVPDVLFRAGVDILAGAAVTDIDLVADRIAGRTSVPELHGTGLAKGVIVDPAARPLDGFVSGFGSNAQNTG